MLTLTNYPQLTTTAHATDTATGVPARVADGLVHLLGSLNQVLCGVRGHDSMLHFEGNRIMMRCASCGHDSHGWEITGRPRQRFEGDPRRHLISRPLLLRKSA
jgi:hypothetical protein